MTQPATAAAPAPLRSAPVPVPRPAPACPDCGQQAVPQGGCAVCFSCGYSRCG